MDGLPLEMKCLIAEWAGEDECQDSIQALSKVNREWNKICTPVLHEHLVIRLNGGEVPHKLLQLSDENAQSVLRRLKRLSLVAEWYNPGLSDSLSDTKSRYMRRTRDRFRSIPRVLGGVRLGELDSEAIPRVGSYTGDWSPIVDLIKRIPSLRNINIIVHKGGPVELFEVLSRHHPTCQVSIFTTWPISPSQGAYGIIGENWARSPMLHAVHVTYFENPRTWKFIEHPDRLLQCIVLLAPQLREISLRISSADLPSRRPSIFNEHIHVEEGLKNEKPPAKLETLLWPLNSKMTAGQLREWQTITDFRLLKVWGIGCVEDSSLLQAIVDIQPFQRLERLTLALVPPKGVEQQEFWGAAESMFHSLPLLTYLWILGSYTPAFLNSGVLERHGSSLLELKLWRRLESSQEFRRLAQKGPTAPIFSAEDILELASRCPALQKLYLCTERTQHLETDTWTAFGRFPCLRELDIVLNCSPKTGPDMMPDPPRDLSDFENGLVGGRPRWFLRECMINCAISESLAKAYFVHILACQNAKYLTRLILRPVFSKPLSFSFFNRLALTWEVNSCYLAGLHVTSKQEPDSSITETRFEDEMFEILNSI